METRLGFLKQKDKKNTTNYTVNTNKDLQEKMNKLQTQAAKIKFIKEETQ